MKKRNMLFLTIVMCIFLSACGVSNVEEEEVFSEQTELTLMEKIEQLQSLEELYDGEILIEKEAKNEARDEVELVEAQKALLTKWEEFALADLNGFYYNREPLTNAAQSYLKMGKIYKWEDDRAIYVKSKEEVYFYPCLGLEEVELKNIPNMDNSEKYCYTLYECEEIGKVIFKSKFADETLDEKYQYLNVWWSTDGYLGIAGGFLDEMLEDGEYYNISSTNRRSYYNSVEASLEEKALREGKSKESKEERENARNNPPKVGMTEDEVKGSKWGHPKKVNRDEYSWGVVEQWVYDEGYVYFENGIVTSIQKRD